LAAAPKITVFAVSFYQKATTFLTAKCGLRNTVLVLKGDFTAFAITTTKPVIAIGLY
jgi:hypothetical protein